MATQASMSDTLLNGTVTDMAGGLGAERRSWWSAAREILRRSGAGEGWRAEFPDGSPPVEPGLTEYLSIPVTRPAEAAHRILHIGDLSPESGAADFLNCVILWAEQHPDRIVNLCWAGEGDLRGVLRAQPLPPTVHQRFTGALTQSQIAGRLAHNGLLAAPSLSRNSPPYLLEAMASGVIVLGSARNLTVRSLVTHQDSGWLFDPHSPHSMLVGLNAMLELEPRALDVMRERARARASAFHGRTSGNWHERPAPDQ